MRERTKVEIKEITIGGKRGYDVLVLQDDATVTDYLEALNGFIEEASIDRQRHLDGLEATTCMACHNCCQERIPLTSVDLLQFAEHIPVKEIFERYIRVAVHGRVVDITLKLGPQGICRFNRPDTKLCSLYKSRPFVCQTYICCSTSSKARALRETVLNTGEDQLVRDWLGLIEKGLIEPKIDEAEDLDLREEDWEPTPFEGKKSYNDILLKDLCSFELWEKLRGVRS